MTHLLTNLPDDILFLVLVYLDSARYVSALSRTCRRLHHLVQRDGWRIFVRNRFPSLSAPAPATGHLSWQQVAESMTWQSRCWDRRSLQFQAIIPHPRRAARSGDFMSVIDAHFDPASQQELVVWGAGEDVVARYRQRRGPGRASQTSWHRLDGEDLGLRAGYDDIKTIKIVAYGGGLALIAGRYNGQLSLLSADPARFGECIAQFGAAANPDFDSHRASARETINSLDVLDTGGSRLLAAAAESSVRIYELPEGDPMDTAPVTIYDLKDDALTSSSAKLGRARWMEQGASIALALVCSKDPLRYLSLSPAGWSLHAAAKSERVAREFNISYDRTIAPNSLEPVYLHPGARRGTSLLLSAWRDGTIRLQDLRTPSAFDAVYQNNVDPGSNTETLMAYGTERFVAGGTGLAIEVFDFRWPKSYHHTAGLPCYGGSPFPKPHQPFLKPPSTAAQGRARCDHVRGLPCHWHALSAELYHRPNAKFFLSQSVDFYRRTTAVWSLARASDVSPNFYVGVSGAVVEACLEQTPDSYAPERAVVVDPNFGFPDWRAPPPSGSGYWTRPAVPALMETGDGYSFKGNDRSIVLPGLLRYRGPREWTAGGGRLQKRHRLDIGYQQEADFRLILS
ncbi:45b7c5c2-88fa-460a-b871-072a49cfd959 [Thermothielavioides terrestris]|uniref:45b7c5c2-88fa-460a-b871-072a49cfd959 n=1 Tax=Thermothielavioides terrestris TaxID=2587410 RepID=A0A3S4F7J8_9PEZI|nr:45b7c5c2-88fa-460a-b871-072a49cfd959 [Thermothielavioides terrestris]